MMVGGYTNLLMGNRGCFYRCKYWERNSQYKDLAEYKHKIEPKGVFMAKRENSTSQQKNELNNMFLYGNESIMISTKSTVDIKPNDLVEFDGEIWVVQNVQYVTKRSNEQYMKKKCRFTYIQLKR